MIKTMKIGKRTINALGSIKQEKAHCIKAWKKHRAATRGWCCHHKLLFEWVGGLRGAMERIGYISRDKPAKEQASRFRSFRPVIEACGLKQAGAVLDRATKANQAAFDAIFDDMIKAKGAYEQTFRLNRDYRARKLVMPWGRAIEKYNKAMVVRIRAVREHDRLLKVNSRDMNVQWPHNTWTGRRIWGT
jgi:hypothetical protein